MITLSDTQSILLATAAQRENGSVLPLHGSVKPGGGAAKARANLLKQGLVEERETTDATTVHRTEGDVRFGLYITAAGLAAIGLGDDDPAATSPTVQLPEIIDVEKAPSKIATVLKLISCDEGVPVSELMTATGWLPHTIRAALTGLRKKGHHVQRIKRDGVTCYRIFGAA